MLFGALARDIGVTWEIVETGKRAGVYLCSSFFCIVILGAIKAVVVAALANGAIATGVIVWVATVVLGVVIFIGITLFITV